MQPIVKTLVFVVAIPFFALAVPRVQANSVPIITQTSAVGLTELPGSIFATGSGFFSVLTGEFASTADHGTAMPERATMLLLGGSLAGFATNARRRAASLKRTADVRVSANKGPSAQRQ